MAKKSTATTTSQQEATVEAVVRRFQGRYECGCTVDKNVPQPTECVNHGHPGVYEVEVIHIENTEIGSGFAELFKEV